MAYTDRAFGKIKRVAIQEVEAGAGDSTIAAAVTGAVIRVLALALSGSAATTVRLESTAGGTALTGTMHLGVNTSIVLPYNPVGWGDTVKGELLNLENSAAATISGVLVYEEIEG